MSRNKEGGWLAFARNTGSAQSALLYEVPVDATGAARGAERLIPAGRSDLRSIAWSADGRSFVCETQAGLVRIPRNGGALQQLAFPDATEPSVALAGNRLVYVRSRRDVDIFSIPGAGAAGAPVDVISSSRMDGAPSYSFDGKRIAFTSDRTGSAEIWVSDSKGDHVTQLTTSGGDLVGCPRWSPDGQSIAFDSTSTAGTHIVLVPANGGAARPITTGNSRNVRPSWSSDGKWIYFGSNRSGRWEIWKAKADGTGSAQVTRKGGREAFEDAGGRFLYYAMEPPASGIWRTPVSGGEEEMVTNQGLQGRWALGERGLYYLKGENELERLALSDRSTLTIASAGLQLIAGTGGLLSISPGERSILVTASIRLEGELMMVEGFR